MSQKSKQNTDPPASGQRPFLVMFSSQEEAEIYNLKENLAKSDMEKFHLYCRMMRIGKMLSSAANQSGNPDS